MIPKAEKTSLAVKTVKNTLMGLRKQGTEERTGDKKGRTEQVRLIVPASLPYERDGDDALDDLISGLFEVNRGRVIADGPMRRHKSERARLQGIHCESVRVLLGQRDPADGERHRRMASKAARSKANRKLAHLKAQPQELTRDVLTGEIKTARRPWPNPVHAASGRGAPTQE